MAVSRCLAALEGSQLELADSRLELEGSLLEGHLPRDKGEVDRPSLTSRFRRSEARSRWRHTLNVEVYQCRVGLH